MKNPKWSREKYSRESVSDKRFLTAEELSKWSQAEQNVFWAPTCELVQTDSTINIVMDLPGCGADDVQVAFMPDVVMVKKTVRLLASRTWKDFLGAVLGPVELFRRFDLPASIDVNRVKAELEMGVLTVIAPTQAAKEQPAKGVPDRPHAFAA